MSSEEKPGADLPPDMLKEKHKLLWEEIRYLRDTSLKLLQWGATFLATLQTAFFFIRKDVYEKMVETGELTKGQYIPWERYLIGTFFLFLVATVFAYLLIIVGNRYRKFRQQLVDTNIYKIDLGEIRKSTRYVVLFVFYVFPIVDVLIRLYIKVELGFK